MAEELAPWTAQGLRITDADLETALLQPRGTPVNGSCYTRDTVYVVAGRVYWASPCPQGRKPWFVQSLQLLAAALAATPADEPPVPDVTFVLNVNDWPVCARHASPGRPLPCFDLSTTDEHWAIRFPGFAFGGFDSKVIDPARLFADAVPWASRAPVAVFRGQLGCYVNVGAHAYSAHRRAQQQGHVPCPRYVAWAAGQAHPDLLDVGLVGVRVNALRALGLNETQLPTVPRMGVREHAAYRYLIHLDGQTYAYRLQTLLALGSTVLKQTSPFREFYYDLLRPNVHYVPFYIAADGSTNLADKVRHLRANDDLAQRVARRGMHFVRAALNGPCIAAYWRTLLRAYHALLVDPVVLPATAEPVPAYA